MEKKYVNPEALEIDNQELERAMNRYMEEKTPDGLVALMEALKSATFLVPVDFPKEIDPNILEKMRRKERLKPGELPQMLPVLVVNQEKVRFAPAFVSKEHLPKEHNYKVIMTVDFPAVLKVARSKEVNASGIILNPATTRLILNPNLLELMEKVVQGTPAKEALQAVAKPAQNREVRMTHDQFHVFVRRNVEVNLLPKMLFQEKGAFMERISRGREQAVMNLYKSLYKDKLPFPYTERDFDVMDLEISDTLSITALGLPEKNLAPGVCQSVYLVWNPKTDEVQYYIIEKTKEADVNKMGRVLPEGQYQVIGDAPAHGSEMSSIIEMLENQD